MRWPAETGMTRSPHEPSRREFLAGAAGVAGAALAVSAGCRSKTPYDPRKFAPLPETSDVLILPARDYAADISGLVSHGLRELGLSLAGKRVLLKPNLVEYEPGSVINTHPHVVAGVADAVRRAGARDVVVGEGPGHRRDTEYLVTATGLGDVLRELRAPFVDLNLDDVHRRPLASQFMELADFALPASVLAADVVISLPKLKTHHWAGMTCGIKNLFGVVPGAVYGWPKNILHWRNIHHAMVDLLATVRPALVVVDAIVAMEGDGPIMGRPKQTGFIAMGRDAVAVDATCARAMRIDPMQMPYLKDASAFLGHLDERKIRQRGEPIARVASEFSLIESLKGLRATGG
jgi:uncharacterized protein (DUF362 family)